MNHNKGITLIELMVVVIVLGILAVIAVPNIKNIRSKAQISAALENKNTVQKGLDRYFLDKQELPVSTAPTKEIPAQIDWNKLVPPYIRNKPTDLGKIFYWVDYNNTVWVSDTDAPKGVTLGADNKTVTWSAVEGATGYEVGYIEESAAVSNSKIMAGNGYKELQEITGATSYVSPVDLSGKTIVVSSISDKFKSVPVGAGYGGYVSETSLETPAEPSDQLSQLQLGQYVKYGKFNGYDLTWQVVKKADGDVMLFATEPLKNADGTYMGKAFDTVPATGETTDAFRNTYGSNNWNYSDMRIWLNNDFYNIAFTNKSYIKNISHDYVLADIDKSQATSGNTDHIFNITFSTALQNYNTTAYKKSVTDKIYLTNIKEIVENIQPIIGTAYYNSSYYYWLRDSYSSSSCSTRFIYSDGRISKSNTYVSTCCIRPTLSLSSVIFKTGSGTQNDPYVIE